MHKQAIKREIVEFYRRKNNMSVTNFCKECGISKQAYDKIMKYEECSLLSILKIARRMNIELKEIFPPLTESR